MDERALQLARYRSLLALCEANPDLPVPAIGDVCLLLCDDADGRAEIERIVRVLRRAGSCPSMVDDGNGSVYVVAEHYRAFYVGRSRMADYRAHMSYVDNVHAEAAPTGSAAA